MRTETITSRENKWLKKFRAALCGSGPASGDPIGVEGPKLVEQAVRAGLKAEALLVTEAGEAHLARILQAGVGSETGASHLRILRTTEKLFAGVAGTETPQGSREFSNNLHGNSMMCCAELRRAMAISAGAVPHS